MKEPRLKLGGGAAAPLSTLARASAGVGTVLLGAYVVARLKHSRKRKARLERLEAMLAELTRESEARK